MKLRITLLMIFAGLLVGISPCPQPLFRCAQAVSIHPKALKVGDTVRFYEDCHEEPIPKWDCERVFCYQTKTASVEL